MPTDKDRRAVLKDWYRRIASAARLPLARRPKKEAIILDVCIAHLISRRTLFNWKAKLG